MFYVIPSTCVGNLTTHVRSPPKKCSGNMFSLTGWKGCHKESGQPLAVCVHGRERGSRDAQSKGKTVVRETLCEVYSPVNPAVYTG